MTDTGATGEGSQRPRPVERIRWMASAGIVGTVGGFMMAVVGQWAEIEPVLQRPATAAIAMLAFFILGCCTAYWLLEQRARDMERRARDMAGLQRQTEDRLERAEGVIKDLRKREIEQLELLGELGKKIAVLETSIEFLKLAQKKGGGAG